MYKPYEFRTEDALRFANHMNIRAKEIKNELFLERCPYCKGLSKGSRADKQTCSINLSTGLFKCFRASCGAHGNMITLSQDFDFSLGNEIDEYYKPHKKFKQLKTPSEAIVPKQTSLDYLEARGISKATAEKYQITAFNGKENILVFPFFDEFGKMQFIKYRKMDFDKEKDKCKEWCEKDCKPILFGMDKCNLDNKTLVFTEGQIDSLSVAEAFDGEINVVSVPTGAKGMSWTSYCWNWLCKFDKIIIFGDYERGEITLLKEISQRVRFSTIFHVNMEDYKDCKDANEILLKYGKEQVKACVENAVQQPVNNVISLADVEDVDIYKLEKLKTGINDIDRLLYGGLPFGGLHIISGVAGEGKSTLASQIMINAVEQNYTCFAYSGELPNYLFKAWTMYQIAGIKNITEYPNQWGDINYTLKDGAKKQISEWLKDKYYIYDNGNVGDDEKESLVKTCENVIKQYGVRVILLDNLMTAIDLEEVSGTDKYEKQSQFVKKLSRLALKYNVIILLVAHKRKNSFSTNENNEISGSGDISNLALITISYGKDGDLEPTQRKVKVSKNRLFGKTNTSGWVLEYQDGSKRIYGSGDNVNRRYLNIDEVEDGGWIDIPLDKIGEAFAEFDNTLLKQEELDFLDSIPD